MAYIILIVALIAAGVYTENVAFYWVAGGVGAISVILTVVALAAANKIRREMNDMTKGMFGDDFYNRFKKR